MLEEESLEATPENRHRGCRHNMLGILLQARAAATGKARSPTVDSRVPKCPPAIEGSKSPSEGQHQGKSRQQVLLFS